MLNEILDFFNVIVPVELISFTASREEQDILLHWSTATELNNQGFEIQRSNDNKTFNRIGFIEGKGTTTETQEYSFRDNTLTAEGKYFYRLKQIDHDGTYNYSEMIEIDYNYLPTNFSLFQNYPNPFNPSTKIKFTVPAGTQRTVSVQLKVYDVLGNEVATLLNEEKPAGIYEIEFSAIGGSTSGGNAYTITSGIYFYKLTAGNFAETKKMILIK